MAKNERAKKELKGLRDDGKKIDHTVNATKDCSDAICGSIWNCANSNNIVSRTKVTRALLNPQSFEPQQIESVEMMEFERLKQSYASGLFKGL